MIRSSWQLPAFLSASLMNVPRWALRGLTRTKIATRATCRISRESRIRDFMVHAISASVFKSICAHTES